MKNSIKRAQSQACLGFAERKNFRPLAELKKLSLTLALLITAAASAWADETNPEVTITQDATTKQYEASFQMPQYDVTATYTIKRDMTVDVAATIDDRIRIQMVNNAFQAVDATQMNPVVKDNLETNSPVTLTETTDYTLTLQKQGDTEDDWTDVTALSVGTFRYKITGAGNYSGVCYSEEFELFQGYEVEVAAQEFITYYSASDNLTLEENSGAKLYTITGIGETKATATEIPSANKEMPFLVYNPTEETKTFLLIPTDAEINQTCADEFKGTATATTIAASTDAQTNYAFNGKQFVWVRTALPVAANKAWLEVPTSTARSIALVFADDDATAISAVSGSPADKAAVYDLNGRKLDKKPTRKGVYIQNGKKVVVK